MTFRGYAYLNTMEWEKARTTFIAAQSKFNHPHYDELMVPLFQTIEEVSSVSMHNKYLVFLFSTLFPGGGQFLLKDWRKGQGILSSVGLMALITNWAKVEQFVGSNRFVDNYSVTIPSVKNYNNENKKHGLSKSDEMPSSLTLSKK